MATNDTRDTIIQTGAELITQNGFSATGINRVLSEAGVPKGSFYHYFKSKDDFGLAVIDAYAQTYDDRLNATLGDTSQPPLERLKAYLQAGEEDMCSCDYSRGCLIGNLGQELAAQNEAFRARLDRVFSGWESRFADCIAEAREAGDVPKDVDPETAAAFLLSGWQGALLRAKMARSVEPMRRFESTLFNRVLGA
ncbi:TetR family transcriptional regulator [Tamilnaduibacter salinus]|uniref:TetR family transcriptional regulator n=1 Tax=Tamilnaduibacter salinus TaxID=1484056 RepID=A0A2A2HZX5_9GAMM|nr:TetR/AcrR family transcriptional regulator [Tamilnaduibacter salinus]PAV24708.1 TetR family transcriptional regulator [Tamilnaduibacter salinus]PVY79100.1 TetR family transcriptional regulator [Tamilnaduibacter salinus]